MDAFAIEVRWYAIHVRRRFEKMVARNLERQNLESFLPLSRCRRRSRNGSQEIEVPLFPGYVFCRLDITCPFPILTIPGVKALVGVGSTPTPVDECEILSIRSLLASGSVWEPWEFPTPGQTVRVVHGAMAGARGKITCAKNQQWLIIPIHALQRAVAVEIGTDCVRPVETDPVVEPAAVGQD
jgi:transcription antitermination factor NusG